MTVTNALLDIVGYFDTWPALCSGLNFAEGQGTGKSKTSAMITLSGPPDDFPFS